MPLQRRLPKRGFHNPFRQEFSIVNLAKLEARFESGAVGRSRRLCAARGLVRRNQPRSRSSATGRCRKALTVKAHAFSAVGQDRDRKPPAATPRS